MTAPTDSSIPAKVFFPWITLFLFFPSFSLLLLIIASMGGCSEGYKNEVFFTFYNNSSRN